MSLAGGGAHEFLNGHLRASAPYPSIICHPTYEEERYVHPPGSPSVMPIVWAHSSARPFVIIGGVCIIGGGLLSAIMAGAPSYHASWAVAYIVLIPGVAQFVLGTAQAALTTGAVPRRLVAAEALSWNLGNAGVVAGTLAGIPAVLYVGDALMLVALATVVTVLSGVPHSKSRTAVWFLVALLVAGSVIGIVIQATTG